MQYQQNSNSVIIELKGRAGGISSLCQILGHFFFLLRFALFLACELQIDRKTFLCIFFLHWFMFHS